MQTITVYALANSTLGSIRDYANAKASAVPAFTRAFPVVLQLRLFATDDDETAYPISAFSSVTSWQCVWDKDYSQSTTPIIFADNSDIYAESVTETIAGIEREFTQITIPISSMNTQQIVDWIGTDESKSGLVMELIGFDSTSSEVFGLQLKGFSMRNRIYYGGTPTVIEPEYLTASQVRALIASGVDLQYSNDGTSWHDTQTTTDSYLRFRSASDASATWSSAVHLPQGANGEDGDDAYVYIRYANNSSGGGFSTTPSSSLPYVAVKTTTTEIASPTASDFSGLWVKYFGEPGADGENGVSTYTYVGYASNSTGANFSLTPTSSLKYRAEIHTTTEITNPTSSDFSSATWVKYIGDDGEGNGDMLKSIYDPDNDGVVEKADALNTARSIGMASFDGSADISLAQIGAAPSADLTTHTSNTAIHVPSTGTTGYVLTKTSNGAEWQAGGSASAVAFASITGQPTDNTNLASALGDKITNPSGGSTGQYLKKTDSGVAWADVSASIDYKNVRTVSSLAEYEAIRTYCLANLGTYVFFLLGDNSWCSSSGYTTSDSFEWVSGHTYIAFGLDLFGTITVITTDATPGVVTTTPKTLNTISATVYPGIDYSWTLGANSTISADGGSSGKWGSCEIDINPGAYTLTAGTNMTFVDTPITNKLNHCVVKWRGDAARLYVVDVEG